MMLARIACTGFYWFLALAAVWLLAGGKWLATWTFLVGTLLYLGFMGAHLVRTRRQLPQRLTAVVAHLDEAVLLGPVSAWVAEGEARAVRDWEAKQRPRSIATEPDCIDCEWVDITAFGSLHRQRVRSYPCDRHGGRLPNAEPLADISGIKMVEIR